MFLDKYIEKEIIINTTLDAAWDAWTTEEGLKSFFVKDCRVELRPGGPYELYFLQNTESKARGSEGCIVLSYIPKSFFSFSWNAPPQFKEVRENGQNTMVFLHFYPLATGKSIHLTLRHSGWQAGNDWQEVYDYFDSAWTNVLNWMKKNLEE